jgi:hypothetical protein
MITSIRETMLLSLSLAAFFVSAESKTAEPTLALLQDAQSVPFAQLEPTPQQRQQCPAPVGQSISPEEKRTQLRKNPRAFNDARVVVGIDVLGRAVVGIDSDRDGFVDLSFMFTDTVRLEGPWSMLLEHATVFLNDGSAKLESHDRSFGMSVALEAADAQKLTPRKYATVLIRESGFALTRAFYEEMPYVLLTALDVNSVYTWPATFQQDMYVPGTFGDNCNCVQLQCQAGGCGSSSCSMAGVCSVSCSSGFACCKTWSDGLTRCSCFGYSSQCFQ